MSVSLKANAAGTQAELLLNGVPEIVITPDATIFNGAVTLAQNATTGLQATTYQQVVPFITGPAFIATVPTQTVGVSQVQLTNLAETIDTNNCFSNSRFTPNIAGLYQINGSIVTNQPDSRASVRIYKNGNAQLAVQFGNGLPAGEGNGCYLSVSTIVQLNGTTDFVALHANINVAGYSVTSGQFNGALIRAL